MTRRKKLLIVFLIALVLSQIPFAYRRYQLRQLRAAIQAINNQRIAQVQPLGFVEYTGVLHVHSFLGGHSKGNFADIIAAAATNKLAFVVMTEHTSGSFNTAAMTLKGTHGGVLFINGNEVSLSSGDRFLVLPGDETATSGEPTEEMLSKAKSRGALSLVAYPQEFKSWKTASYDGVEVYNVYTNAREVNPVVMLFDGLWSYRTYPDLLFARLYSRPDVSLAKWDEAIASRKQKMTAVAGNDAHENIGLSLVESSGKTLLGFQLDPYVRSFQLVRIHALIPSNDPLSQETLLSALAAGHCFIGFDLFGDTTGFSLTASNGTGTGMQGDEIKLDTEVRISTLVPVNSRVVLFRDGQRVDERRDYRYQEFIAREKGVYRVEVYLPQLPTGVAEQPWIISNAIYVR